MNNKQNNNMSKLESYLFCALLFMRYLMVELVYGISVVLIVGSIASSFVCLITYNQTNGDMHSTLAPFLFGVPMAITGMASLMLHNVLKDKFDNETSSHER